MAKTGDRSRRVLALVWLAVGAAMVGVPVWLGWTRWQPILVGHPLVLALSIACGLMGFVALAWAVASLVLGDRSDDDATGPRAERLRAARANRRIALAVPALFGCTLLVLGLVWSRPFPATEVALAAMRSGNDVRVSDRLTWYEMTSTARDSDDEVVRPTTGLVFVPGARVDPRAYAHVLRPLAEAGYLVTVLKEPFGTSLLDASHPARVIGAHPEIARWVLAGHALGGTTAAAFADDHATVGGAPVAGLVLWAATTAGAVDRADLKVTSISAGPVGASTPDEGAPAKPGLPPGTTYVVVPGSADSIFGDYEVPPDDGVPAADRAAAQAEIPKATRAVLAAVTPKPKTK